LFVFSKEGDPPDLQDDFEVLMIPKQLYQLYDGEYDRDYGACTYQQIVEQTAAGKAKFYSCLYYLVSKKNSPLVAVGYSWL
jgi:hypothetical protein